MLLPIVTVKTHAPLVMAFSVCYNPPKFNKHLAKQCPTFTGGQHACLNAREGRLSHKQPLALAIAQHSRSTYWLVSFFLVMQCLWQWF
jgi:hypothetical protein